MTGNTFKVVNCDDKETSDKHFNEIANMSNA